MIWSVRPVKVHSIVPKKTGFEQCSIVEKEEIERRVCPRHAPFRYGLVEKVTFCLVLKHGRPRGHLGSVIGPGRGVRIKIVSN